MPSQKKKKKITPAELLKLNVKVPNTLSRAKSVGFHIYIYIYIYEQPLRFQTRYSRPS